MKKINAYLIIFLLLFSMLFVVMPVTAFEKEVYNFDRIWYSQTNGFNKNGDGTLILATTYINNSFRNIDYCSIVFTQDPFYFAITLQDELTIQRDPEGNIIYQEPSDGYIFLRKSVIDAYIPEIKRLATKGITYKTITFQSVQWYRISVPNFNRAYEWKEFDEPTHTKWYTWGNNQSISFKDKAMYIKQTKESNKHLEFDFSHPTDNSGQVVSFSKSYLNSTGITTPYFEWGEVIPWKVISYTENETHYFINPEHFSTVGVHEASSGDTYAEVTADLYNGTSGSILDESTSSTTAETLESVDVGEYVWQHFTPKYPCFKSLYTKVQSSSGDWSVNISIRYNSNDSVILYRNLVADVSNTVITVFDENEHYYDTSTRLRFRMVSNIDNSTDNCVAYGGKTDQYGGTDHYFHSSIDGDHTTWDMYWRVRYNRSILPQQVSRTAGGSSERNLLTTSMPMSFQSNDAVVVIKIPVSTSVQGLTEVKDFIAGTVITEVNTSDEVVDDTYWFDSSNDFVWIGTNNITASQSVNFSVNCTYGSTFSVSPPTYLPVGHPFEFIGLIKDANDIGISGYIATTKILFTNGTDAIDPVEYNCSNGNLFVTIATTSLVPGEYDWEISFVDAGSGVTFKKGGSLSLSIGTSGYYESRASFNIYDNTTGTASHSPSFTYYDPNSGMGMSLSFLKLYVSTDTTFTESDRIDIRDFSGSFNTYTGQTLYYKVKDFFDNTIYPTTGNYETVTIEYVDQFIDIPIQLWSFSVKNMNHSIVKFELHNNSRAYIQYLFPYEPFYWYVFNGTYDINITYIDPDTDENTNWLNTTINIDNHTYYWVQGYDLQDIILEIQFTNSSVDNLEITITSDINFVNSTVNSITSDISTNIALFESNVTTINNNIWNAINITDSVVDYVNSTIWNELTYINNNISWMNSTTTYVNDTIWNNFTIVGEEITVLNISIHNSIDLSELNLTALNINIWNDFNLTDSVIGYLNNTIWNNFTLVDAVIDNINNKLTINFDMLNVTVDYINNTIWTEFNTVNSNIGTMETNVITQISLTETNITNLNNNIWNAINITDSVVDNLNNNIWNNLTLIKTTVDELNNNIWTNLTIIHSDVGSLTTSIHSSLTLTETNLTTLNNNIYSSINIVDGIVGYFNNTIWSNLTIIDTVVDTINNNIDMTLSTVNSNIDSVETNIIADIDITESNINTFTSNVWNAVNITDSIVDTINSKIDIDLSMLNVNITYLNSSIWSNFTVIESDIAALDFDTTIDYSIINSSIDSMDISISNMITLSESNLTTLNNNIYNSINVVDGIIDYFNNTIWANLTVIDTVVDTINNKLVIDFNMLNLTVDYLNNTIWTEFTTTNSNIDNVEIDLRNTMTFTETNITNMNSNIWNAINISDSVIDYLNLTVWNNLTALSNDINNMNISFINTVTLAENNISSIQFSFWGDINTTLKNRSVVMFGFYNTNDGLGLRDESFKVYINGTRLTDQSYWCTNGSIINVTVLDYYNSTMYHQNFTIIAQYTFIDLGLTFHSWLFGNKNDKYYMVSLLKDGASRWWERGIVPMGEREFMLPSGNYTMRIYDADWTELYNASHVVNKSMVYIIHGNNLSTVIAGQSVITGNLLELSTEIDYALIPDANYYSYNPIMIFSIFDKIGMKLGQNVWKVCPAKQLIATTRNSTDGSWVNSTPLVPLNNSVANGTITIDEDILYMSGNSSVTWVNITYTGNGTLMQNTSYIPSRLHLSGQNITINASSSINILRETRFNQVKKFYWDIYNSTENTGYLSNRAGYHTATIEFKNPMNTQLYDTYCFIGFSDRTSPDGDTVRVTDLSNDGILLEAGEDFRTTESGIDFKILGGMSASSTRRFQIEYYKEDHTEYIYSEGNIEAGFIEWPISYNDELYSYFDILWINNYDKTFRGGILIKIDLSKIETEIDKSSVIVWDKNNDIQVNKDYITVGDDYIRISSASVGDVGPGGGKSYGVYYQELMLPGSNPFEWHLNTHIGTFIIPWTPFIIIFVFSMILMAVGIFLYIRNIRSKKREVYIAMISISLMIAFIFYILQAVGV